MSNIDEEEIAHDLHSESETEIEEESDSSEDEMDYFSWRDDDDFQPIIHPFTETPGFVVGRYFTGPNALNYFERFFDRNLMNIICKETNQYALQNPPTGRSHMANWSSTNNTEMYIFLALTLLMGLMRKNKINYYWSTHPLLSTPIFEKMLTRDRYLLLLRYLHFQNNISGDNRSRLGKISTVLENLRTKFKRCLKPYRNLCIDESLLLWKGRFAFKQYIPMKRHRFGIKFFVLVDCQTNFILDFILYIGSSTPITRHEELGFSGSVVMSLLERYTGKGHNLFVDNWYSSPTLFNKLHQMKTNCCGTVRKNRRHFPDMRGDLERGNQMVMHTDNLLAVRWADTKNVNMLTTFHQAQMANSNKRHYDGTLVQKPVCILDYNTSMGAVDKTDMQNSFSECIRKTMKWYKKIFFHLLDMAIINSYSVYKHQTNQPNLQLTQFRLQLINEIFRKYGGRRESVPSTSAESPGRLTGRHFPVLISADGKTRRCCQVCSHMNREERVETRTKFNCEQCDVLFVLRIASKFITPYYITEMRVMWGEVPNFWKISH